MQILFPIPAELTVAQIIQVAKISQVLSVMDKNNQNALNGGIIDQRHPYMLYAERKAVEWLNTYNPSDPGLRGMANYLWSLCWPYVTKALTIINNLTGTISITNPSDDSVNVGQNASFSVTVTSSLPYTIQWFRNGVPIAGATSTTYTLINAQLSDSGALFSATATSGAGSASSDTALLTVVAGLQGSYYYGDVDYSAQLMAGIDAVPYVGTFNITHGQPLVVPFGTGAANNKWEVVKYPIGEGAKTIWVNTVLNSGVIPSSVYYAIITIGSFLYIASRSAISLQGTSPTVTYS
jgi:hypothetical protein